MENVVSSCPAEPGEEVGKGRWRGMELFPSVEGRRGLPGCYREVGFKLDEFKVTFFCDICWNITRHLLSVYCFISGFNKYFRMSTLKYY